MKEVIAVIRMNKMNETKKALAAEGIASLTAHSVMGRGKGQVDFRLLEGAKEGYEEAIAQLGPGHRLVPKRMLNIIVNDHNVKRTVETIIRVNKTGNAGDGKIFVSPIKDAIRLRTGENGTDAVLEEGEVIPAEEVK